MHGLMEECGGFYLRLGYSLEHLSFYKYTKRICEFEFYVVNVMLISDRGIIPPRIISQRTVAVGCIFIFCLQLAIMAHAYYIPFYFQVVKDTSAMQSGIRTLAYGIPSPSSHS
jgi:hypothetical protein